MTVSSEPTIIHLDPARAEAVRIGPERVALLVPGAVTGGRQLAIEVTTPPGGGPPLHTHRAQEIFFVVEGDFAFPTIRDGELRTVRATAGEIVFIPSGISHTYQNVGAGIGRLFGVLAPATEIEAFFREAGDPDDPAIPFSLDDQPDIARILAAAAKYQIEFLPPA